GVSQDRQRPASGCRANGRQQEARSGGREVGKGSSGAARSDVSAPTPKSANKACEQHHHRYARTSRKRRMAKLDCGVSRERFRGWKCSDRGQRPAERWARRSDGPGALERPWRVNNKREI